MLVMSYAAAAIDLLVHIICMLYSVRICSFRSSPIVRSFAGPFSPCESFGALWLPILIQRLGLIPNVGLTLAARLPDVAQLVVCPSRAFLDRCVFLQWSRRLWF